MTFLSGSRCDEKVRNRPDPDLQHRSGGKETGGMEDDDFKNAVPCCRKVFAKQFNLKRLENSEFRVF